MPPSPPPHLAQSPSPAGSWVKLLCFSAELGGMGGPTWPGSHLAWQHTSLLLLLQASDCTHGGGGVTHTLPADPQFRKLPRKREGLQRVPIRARQLLSTSWLPCQPCKVGQARPGQRHLKPWQTFSFPAVMGERPKGVPGASPEGRREPTGEEARRPGTREGKGRRSGTLGQLLPSNARKRPRSVQSIATRSGRGGHASPGPERPRQSRRPPTGRPERGRPASRPGPPAAPRRPPPPPPFPTGRGREARCTPCRYGNRGPPPAVAGCYDDGRPGTRSGVVMVARLPPSRRRRRPSAGRPGACGMEKGAGPPIRLRRAPAAGGGPGRFAVSLALGRLWKQLTRADPGAPGRRSPKPGGQYPAAPRQPSCGPAPPLRNSRVGRQERPQPGILASRPPSARTAPIPIRGRRRVGQPPAGSCLLSGCPSRVAPYRVHHSSQSTRQALPVQETATPGERPS